MTTLRMRRHAKVFGLRCLRVVRRHYFSMLSAVVLGGALSLAMTSNAFDVGDPTPPAPAVEAATDMGPADITAAPGTMPTSPGSVVYYFVDSQSVRYEMEMAVHRDLADEALRDYAPLHSVSRVFVMIEDVRDVAEALEFLRQLAISPPLDGTQVRVIDLR